MSRQRFIHPELFQSEDFLSLSHSARLLFIGMFTLADDHGRGKGSAKALSGSIFPGENIQPAKIQEWCRAIVARAMARFYSVAGSIYYDLPSWFKWQNPKWKKDSVIPPFNGVPALGSIPSEPGSENGGVSATSNFDPDRTRTGPGPDPDRGTGSGCVVVVVGDGEGSGRDGMGRVGKGRVLTSGDPPGSARTARATRSLSVRSEYSPSFERFWSAYPRKDDKRSAADEWLRLRPDEALIDLMLSALAWQRESVRWLEEGGKYIPYGVRYLKKRRWEDKPPQVSPLANLTPQTQRTVAALQRWVESKQEKPS